ncbi:molybdopterin-dependent oxidoreductase [Cellulomonas sp. JH27-2]|nr:molybdopterin-dependent oxidoreductase [Cellulomonas sp. JH27-2]
MLRPPEQDDFRSAVHDPRVVARVGTYLGAAIGLAFLTGLVSHLHQSPVPWLPLPTDPAWLYRVTQGLHVAAGTAAIPLLLAKLYAAYPALFARPRVGSPLRGLERASVALLVSTAIFQVVTGLINTFQWYPWSFGFRTVHFVVAWVLVGSIVVHVAVKLPTVADAWRRPVAAQDDDVHGTDADGDDEDGPTRRGFLAGVAVTVLGLTALTVGQTVQPLSGAAILSPRQAGNGPQGLPVNRTAKAAGVLPAATDPGWTLTLEGPGASTTLSRAELEAMEQTTVDLPIACVEGWSTLATWQGVRVRDLVALVGPVDSDVRFVSMQRGGSYRESILPARYAAHPDSLLALRLGGEVLDIDHGYPARLVTPDRPGVLQTKWVDRIEVRSPGGGSA